MKSALKILFAGWAALGFSTTALAAPGDLDTTFGGGDGWVSTGFGGSTASGRSVIQQTDGKLVVGGFASNGSNNDFAAARYNSDGSLDTTFNTTGKVTTAVGSGTDNATVTKQQTDGKIVLGGYAHNGSNYDFAAVRYNSNGALDTSFNGTGKVITPVGSVDDVSTAMTLQSDGKVVVAGYTYAGAGTGDDFGVVRYNSNGTLDTSFDGDGKVVTAVGNYVDVPNAVIQQTDGKLVVVGKSNNSLGYSDIAVVRYNSNGALDTSFNGTGKVVTTVVAGSDYATSVAQDADGKLVIAASTNTDAGYSDFAVLRYNTNGTLDTTFDGDGKVFTQITAPATHDFTSGLVLQSDGKIVVAGYTGNTGYDFALVRYNTNGSLDTTFSGDGKLTFAPGTADDQAWSVIQQADGKLTVAGYAASMPTGQEFVVARYLSGLESADADGDGVSDATDNCPTASNTNQLNTDGDAQGDLCDADDDNDGITDTSNPAIAVAAGLQHSCLLTASGAVKCWGNNVYGQLGDGTMTDSLVPVAVNGLSSGVIAISAGGAHSCALTNTGAMKCWGDNEYGQLGDGTTGDENLMRLTPVLVSGLSSGVASIAAGVNHSCALTSTGALKCWGNNSYGEIGDGSLGIDRLTPVAVSGLSTGVTAIAINHAGYSQLHSCALTSAGAVKCWGNNEYGQLGDGTQTNRLTPVSVTGLSSGVAALTAGGTHSCAVMNTGTLKCWGWNSNGQIGDGTSGFSTYKLTPVDVIGLNNGAAVAAGWGHSCALTNSGAVYCWGGNQYGQLGDSTNTQRNTPVGVSGLNNGVTGVAAGWHHSCAITSGGGVMCWGSGKLGDGSGTNSALPVFVAGFTINDALPQDTDNDGLTNAVDTDDDNDGMPDEWETTYGFNPLVNDANGDADGDGFTNLQEYTRNTNPTVFDAKVKNDYNNDGIAGWIWLGDSNGVEIQSQNWQLTFPLYSANWGVPNRFYHPTFPDQVNWEIVTTGDFNKDGDADILWRNNVTAQWKLWEMQNGLRVSQPAQADFDLAHEWVVVGAGDTDKDGDDDVILNKASTGEVMIWQVQNHAVTATHAVGTKAGYTLNRIGDFNKDGDVDLLFRQVGTDVLITWELQANAFVAERALANTGTGYNPVCAGDFDNDNDDDIMLVNSSTMQEKWFVMENYARTQSTGSTNAGFVFKGCGDYDGDGDADMLWQRSSDDANRVILQQNWGAIKQTVFTNAFGGVNPGAGGYGFVYRGNSN